VGSTLNVLEWTYRRQRQTSTRYYNCVPMADLPVFGARVEGLPYVVRPSAYALVRNAEGALAVVRTPRGVHLPGGGIEAGETAAQTVERETREEAGLVVRAQGILGHAVEIAPAPGEKACFEKRCVFLAAALRSEEHT